MNVRRVRLGCWLLGGAAIIAAAAVVYTTIAEPESIQPSVAAASVTTRPVGKSGAIASAEPTLAAMQAAAAIDLRRPLVDAAPIALPAATVAEPVSAPVTLPITLVGTILESGRSFAIVTTPAGATELKAVGDMTGDAKVVHIDADAVTFELQGQTVVVTLAKPSAPADKEADPK